MSIKLKLLRVQSGMTLEELAQEAELTRSYVSKLERGLSTPSIGVGLRLAKALKVTVEELFDDSSEDESIVIHRAPARRDELDQTPRVVSGALPNHKMVAFVMSPTDQPVRNHPMSHHTGEEILYVLKGSVTLRLARRTETLHAGDSAHFNARIPHKVTSIGKTPASVLLIIVQEE